TYIVFQPQIPTKPEYGNFSFHSNMDYRFYRVLPKSIWMYHNRFLRLFSSTLLLYLREWLLCGIESIDNSNPFRQSKDIDNFHPKPLHCSRNKKGRRSSLLKRLYFYLL